MMLSKEILVPVSVPWQISPSVPYLHIHSSTDGKPVAATFIGFFKCEPAAVEKIGVTTVGDPGEFVCSDSAKGAMHRLVRVEFEDGQYARQLPAFSDLEIVSEENYDWSLVPSGIYAGETAEGSVARVHNAWLSTGNCPDPSMYEVRESKWLAKLRLDAKDWHHYILLGHDDYIEVVAREWKWVPGQPVS